MYFQYGTLTFKVIELVRYERRNIYSEDGTDLLYVRHVLGVAATYAPGGLPKLASVIGTSRTTDFRLQDGDDTIATVRSTLGRGNDPDPATTRTTPQLESDFSGVVSVGLHHSAPETDAELQNRLLVPRKRLILWAYSKQTGGLVRWLESPRPGFTVDATVGPLPLSCDIVSTAGEGPTKAVMFFQIQTDLPPCPVGSDRFVLSHRWEVSHTHDEDNYLTRVTEGTIVFHAGIRDALALNPDAVRNQLIHPVPIGYERKVPSVRQSGDGTTIKYTITDTDPKIMFSPGDSGCTTIEILERCTILTPISEDS